MITKLMAHQNFYQVWILNENPNQNNHYHFNFGWKSKSKSPLSSLSSSSWSLSSAHHHFNYHHHYFDNNFIFQLSYLVKLMIHMMVLENLFGSQLCLFNINVVVSQFMAGCAVVYRQLRWALHKTDCFTDTGHQWGMAIETGVSRDL